MSRKAKKILVEPQAGVYETANKKRDNIIRNVRKGTKGGVTEELSEVYDEAVAQFGEFLSQHGKKRTPERFFILKKIYECQTPVDIQTLFKMVCQEEGLVSLTTIYNNLSLLIDAGLVRKLDLVGGKMAFFEKTLGQEPHGYIICDNCGSISLFKESEFFDIHSLMPRGFRMHDITFHVHGICHKCQMSIRKVARKEQKKQ